MFVRYDYHCVIYGWDEKCAMSEAWIAQMGVNQHPPGSNQPFYNLMAHDGSNRYASQGGAYIHVYSDTFCSLTSQTYFEWTGSAHAGDNISFFLFSLPPQEHLHARLLYM